MRVTKKQLILNAVAVTASSLLMRSIGLSFNAYLAGRVGAEGLGLFSLVMSVYSMAVMLCVSGMRMASTRLNAQALALKKSPRRVIAACLRISGAMGLCAMLLLYSFAQTAATLVGNPGGANLLRLLSFALPFVAMSTSLGGYMAARRRMGIFSAVQTLEQLCRVGLTILALKLIAPNGYALWAVTFGIVAAEGLSFACSLLLCVADLRKSPNAEAEKGIMWQIGRIALPEAVGSWLRSALSTTEQMLIPKRLAMAASEGNALATYGTIQGMAMPILTLPAAPLYAMSGLLVPELTQMRALGRHDRVKSAIKKALCISLLYSCAVAAVLYAFSNTISITVYNTVEPAKYIRALAPLIPMLFTDSVVDNMLRTLDRQAFCMRLNTFDCVLRVLYTLFVLPVGGISAYIGLMYLSEAFNFALSLNHLIRAISPASSSRSPRKAGRPTQRTGPQSPP